MKNPKLGTVVMVGYAGDSENLKITVEYTLRDVDRDGPYERKDRHTFLVPTTFAELFHVGREIYLTIDPESGAA